MLSHGNPYYLFFLQIFPDRTMAANEGTNQIPDEKISSRDEEISPLPKLICMPNEILLKTFAALNDAELLNVAGTCTRFEPIAQNVFDERYASKYFVIEGKYKKSMCEKLIEQFHSGIKSIEVQKIKNIANRHWVMQIARKCPTERLKFVDCVFASVKSALSSQSNLTHLSFQRGCGYSFVKLPLLHNLREFKVHHFDGMYYADYIQVIGNNRQLKVLEIIDDSVNEPYEIFACVHRYQLNLDQLRMINEAKPLKLESPEAVNAFESVSKSVESLGISTDNKNSIECLRQLSISCTNIKQLELFHVDHTLSSEIVEVLELFEQVESLSLIIKSYEEGVVSIVEKLPNLSRLSLKYRCRTPTSNEYVLTMLQKCKNLRKIVVDTHIDRFKPKQPNVNAAFYDEFFKITESREDLVSFELKEEGRKIASVDNKKE